MRENAIFHAGDEDHRKFQALGRVQGHQHDSTRVIDERVLIGS